MHYKALIFDLDGTAVANEQFAKPTQKVIDAVHRAQKHVKVSAATGRPFYTANWVISSLGLTDPVITTAGTQIIDPKTEKILWQETIPKETVKKLLTFLDTLPYSTVLGSQYATFPEKERPKEITQETVIYTGYVAIADTDALIRKIKSLADVSVHAAMGYKPNTYGLHITSSKASKKHAMHKLTELLDVKKEEIIGVGDSDNDLPLFEAVGYKIAMGNATDALKAQADYVAPSVDEDGLAEVIEKCILAKHDAISS